MCVCVHKERGRKGKGEREEERVYNVYCLSLTILLSLN